MSLSYYQIFNDSADTKLFAYTSGSVSPGSTFTLYITGNSSSIVESYIQPYNIGLGVSEQQFLSDSFYPSTPGNAWLWNDGNKVKYIKIHHTSANNQSIAPYINTTNIISFYLDSAINSLGNYLHGDGIQEVEDYALDNSTAFPQNYNLLVVDQINPVTSTAVASSNADNIDFNFFASGSYTWYATASGRIEEPVTASSFSSSLAQGFFPKNLEDFGDEQFFRGWTNANYYVQGNLIGTTGFLSDNLAQFNTGSTERDYDANNPYQHSVLPFFINASHSLELIQSESFSSYNTQNRIVQVGPRFTYTTPVGNYGEAVYETGEYDGTNETGELVYYYKEDTNEFLISDPNSIIDDPKSNVVLYEANNNQKIVSLGNGGDYSTPEGSNIVVGDGEELWLYRGIQAPGTGDVNAWNYNRYLHRPYKIYMVVQTGSNGLASSIKETHVSFSSSLASERPGEGAYIFNSSLNQNVELTASVTLTASHHGLGYGTASYDSSDEYDQTNPPPAMVTWETASLRLYQGTLNNNGFVLASSSIYIDDINTDNELSLFVDLSSSAVGIGDAFRLALFVDTSSQATTVNSALIVTDYDMKISASVPDASDLVPTYLDNILQVSEDCNPVVGNAIDQRPSHLLMDVDYSSELSGALSPINFNQILDGTATKATVPDWNYTNAGYLSGKYIGKQLKSERLNIFTPDDIITLGKVSAIDYKNAYVGYFSKVIDPYPVLNNKTAYYIKYLIDEQGNLLDPALNEANLHNLLGVFSPNEERIGDNNAPKPTRASGIVTDPGESNELMKLEELSDVFKVGYYPSPVLYSQTSSVDYIGDTTESIGIPLTGSNYLQSISNYSDYAFTLQGSVPNTQSTEIKRGYQFITDEFPMPQTVIYQGPSATSSFFYNGATHAPSFTGGRPYMYFSDTSATGSGTGGDGDWNGNPPTSSGGDLSDNYIPSIDYVFYTTGFPRRKTTNWVGNSNTHQADFGDIFFYLQRDDNANFSSPQNMTIQVDSVELDWIGNIGVNMDNPNIINISALSVPMSQVWSYPGTGQPFRISFHKKITSAVEDAGIPWGKAKSMPGNNDGNNVGTSKYRWRVKLSLKEGISGNKIRQKDFIRWKVSGEIDHIMTNDDHFDGRKRGFFPRVPNAATDSGDAIVTMKLVGDNTQAASTTNNAVPNYWSFSSSTDSGGATIVHYDTLNCVSDILNQTYGQNYYQGDLIYNGSYSGSQPTESIGGGLNPDFPYNREPLFVQMGSIKHPWELYSGDEIRFENNENYAREITQIFPPGESNVVINSYPAVKIKLNGELPGSIDLNHFLIRRYDEAKNIVIMDQQKPYGIPVSASSSPGILKPEFIVEPLDKEPEEILDELIDKKILD